MKKRVRSERGNVGEGEVSRLFRCSSRKTSSDNVFERSKLLRTTFPFFKSIGPISNWFKSRTNFDSDFVYILYDSRLRITNDLAPGESFSILFFSFPVL